MEHTFNRDAAERIAFLPSLQKRGVPLLELSVGQDATGQWAAWYGMFTNMWGTSTGSEYYPSPTKQDAIDKALARMLPYAQRYAADGCKHAPVIIGALTKLSQPTLF